MFYTQNEKAIIYITSFDLSYKKQVEILSLTNEPANLISNFNTYASKIEQIIADRNVYDNFCINLTNNYINSYIANLDKAEIQCVTFCSESYPESLKNIEQPPFNLYAKGDVSLLKTEAIAVVGTRTPTAYGKIVTEQFVKGLVMNDFTIISGLAAGVDTISHKTALENNGKTISVLGGGFEYIYPAFNNELSKKISKNGLLLSEYKPSSKPTLYNFPFRNRIIAGLSKGVLITEAGEKSGSLHTKEFALEQGKEVFAVPGNVNSLMSKGTNRIIKSLQGACVLTYEDIVCKFKEKVITSKNGNQNQATIEENLILNALKQESKTFEELQELTKLSISKLNSCLTMFEIRGVVKRLPGNKIVLI